MKKPAKTRRGIIIGTTNATAASGDGAENPIVAPERKLHFQFNNLSSIFIYLPTASETLQDRIRIPTKIKYLRALSYKFVIQ